jgi:hypothetical protein
MAAEDAVSRAVDSKLAEILSRPDVVAEIDATAEKALADRMPEAVMEAAKTQLGSYNAAFKPMVQRAVDEWVRSHAAEIAAKAEEFAAKAMEDPTIFAEVAKYQLSSYIGKIANDAVVRATQRQAKKAARVKKA